MAVELTGSQYTHTASTDDSFSVTVPTDADICIVCVAGYTGTSQLVDGSSMLDKLNFDDDPTLDFTYIEGGIYTGAATQSEAFQMVSSDGNWPGSGPKNIYFSANGSFSEGLSIWCGFYKNVDTSDPIVTTEAGPNGTTNTDPVTSNMSGVGAGDMCVAACYSYSNVPDMAPTGYGQTALLEAAVYRGACLGVGQELGEDAYRIESVTYCAALFFVLKESAADSSILPIKFTLGQIEHKPNIVLHDFPYQTGSTDYLDEKFSSFDDNAASSTITADIGNNANWETIAGADRNTNTSGDSVSTDYGTGLDTQGGTSYIDLALGNYLNAFFIKGSIQIRCQPQFDYDDAADQVLWNCWISDNDQLLLFYDAGTDQFHFTVSWGGTSTTVTSEAYTTDDEVQMYQLIQPNWDSTTNKIELNINGKVVDSDTNTGTPSSSNPTKVTLGAEHDYLLPGDYILISALSFNSPIFSYGAYFTGNSGTTQLADGMYHKDILFYWDCESADSIIPTTPITGTWGSSSSASDLVETTPINGKYYDVGSTDNNHWMKFTGDIATPEQGSISFWMNLQTFGSTDGIFYLGWDSDNYIKIFLADTETDKVIGIVRLGGTSEVFSNYDSGYAVLPDLLNDGWVHWRITWKEAEFIRMYVNGVFSTEETTVGTAGTSLGNPDLYISSNNSSGSYGADMWIDEFYITNNPNTPQIPTANGVPLDMPIVRND